MTSKLHKSSLYSTAAALTIASAVYFGTSPRRPHAPNVIPQTIKKQKMLPSYEATFSVSMSCDSCTRDISTALSRLSGIEETSYSIPSQLVTVKTTEPPSSIIAAIQSTGRAAILRGSGNPNSAAVCILETPPPSVPLERKGGSQVRGLIRLIELGERVTLLDLTLTGMREGRYKASVRETGDISDGGKRMGDVFTGLEGRKQGEIGDVLVDKEGRGNLVDEVGLRVWEMVGRGALVERVDGNGKKGGVLRGDEAVVGVIARSAGMWENEKTVCSCTGKTVWEEREQMVSKGML